MKTLVIALVFWACSNPNEQPIVEVTSSVEYEAELVIGGLGIAWAFTWLPNGDMLITERSGDLHRARNGALVGNPIEGLPEVVELGQGGLLDVQLHPDYENNGWIYITYASSEGQGSGANTALMRARLNEAGTGLVDQEVLYKATPNTTRGQHFGSRIVFDNAGYVYFSVGDRGNRDTYPQNPDLDGGKIYRLHDDGRIPDDNPFVDDDGLDAVYSYGHRNPQGMAKHPATGEIWAHEHGPRGGDELNKIRRGANYGWPIISYGINYNGTTFAEGTARAGMEQPELYWVPSIAPSGMVFVNSDRYPGWEGDVLIGSLKFSYITRVDMDGDTIVGQENLVSGIGRVRDVRQGPDGYVYFSVDGRGIFRLVEKTN
ncbi:MAG: PQQ-dependent sugar dehydrogenase [Bacteroidota bacterium]